VRGCCSNGGVANFPLLSEEGWTRPQQNIAKPPLWSGRGGDQIPQNFVDVEHHLLVAARYRACIRSAHAPLRELRRLRNFFLIAQPPLLGEEGKIRHTTIWATTAQGRGQRVEANRDALSPSGNAYPRLTPWATLLRPYGPEKPSKLQVFDKDYF